MPNAFQIAAASILKALAKALEAPEIPKEATEQTHEPLCLDQYLKLYGMYKDYMEHESILVNNRLTWILTIHGFLYATYGFTIQKQLEVTNHLGPPPNTLACYTLGQTELFLAIITLVGAFISFFGLRSIWAAQSAAAGVSYIFDSDENKAHRREDIRVQKSQRTPKSLRNKKLHAYVTFEGYRLPNLRGGGLELPVKEGNTAANKIPIILLMSWILSFVLLALIYIKNKSQFCLPWDSW